MEREKIFEYVQKVYGTEPEYLWKQYPDDAVLRAQDTKKWYAVIMKIPKEKLGMEDSGDVEIMNVKCEPEMVHVLTQAEGFFPGYHMNKAHWVSIILDGTVDELKILDFLDRSYKLVIKRK